GPHPPVLHGLAPMGEDQLRQVIHGPAGRTRLVIAERFVARILADLDALLRGPCPPAPGLAAAMFGVALSETFACGKYGERCIDSYEAAGALTGAIGRAAEAAIAGPIARHGEAVVRRFVLDILAGTADARGCARPLVRDEA